MNAQPALTNALRGAAHIALRFARGELTAQQFVEAYANFYYVEALDGHEATSAAFMVGSQVEHALISFHQAIQQRVIDRLDVDETWTTLQRQEADRITPGQARALVVALLGDVAHALE